MSPTQLTPALLPLGRTSLRVSPLAWGMWRFGGQDLQASRAKIEAALEIGINFFDTADIYGPDNGEAFGASEALLGRLFAADRTLRERMVLASKGGIQIGVPYDSSAKYLEQACEASLRRLGVDHLDLYMIHRPDVLTHPSEVAAVLTRLREAGKIREAGVSNYTTAQVAALQAHLSFPLACHQPEFSPLAIQALEDGVLDQCVEREIGVMAWSPLGGGRLGDVPEEPRARRVYDALKTLADRAGVSVSAVAYAWVMAHPARPVPIVGSQSPARIREAADAYQVTLSRTDWYQVLVASRGVPLP
ncbi:MAG: aldo/keto reductase [Candidatus Sericytochromatia bacterium]|nr:aldo/keto reductase [Candidatus Sericytochromatia bacterium]